MTVLVKKEWLRTYGGAERSVQHGAAIQWSAVYRYAWLLAVVFVTVFFFIWQNVQIIRSGYEIERLKHKLNDLQAQNSLLTVEAASLEDLAAAEQRAVHEMGMVRPAPGQLIYARYPGKEGNDGSTPKLPAPDTTEK